VHNGYIGEQMRKLISFVFGISIICISAAQAVPFHQEQTGLLVIPVASGCGLGVHRGPYDGCEPIYDEYYNDDHRSYRRGYRHGYRHGYNDGFYDGFYYGPPACYRVCNIFGICWAACY
jgi:hypothetical protein